MASSLRCRIRGCEPDDCGVCRRCGDARNARHAWSEVDRTRPCFRRMVCDRCQAEKESPDHDWEPTAVADRVDLKCSRCGLSI